MRIIITGTPGTGKSLVAGALARRMGIGLLDIKDFVNAHGIYRKGGREKVVDTAMLKARLFPVLDSLDDYIVEGHLACEMKLPADFIFVLRTNPKVLEKRLSIRDYGKEKLGENLMAEMLDYCTQRVEQVYGKTPLELDTTRRSAEQSANRMLKAIKQKEKKLDSPNYTRELKAHLRLKP